MVLKFQKYKITYTLILLNVFIYFISIFLSQNIIDIDVETLVNMGAIYGPYTVLDAQWWRLGSAMFLHGGMTHLLMNMFSLYLIGRGVESYFDTKSYIIIYIFSGLLGSLASLYMHPESVGVGASGAIFGVFGALAGFFLAHRNHIEEHTKSFMRDFSIIIGINLIIGFSIPSVDMSAHIGGLVVGFLGGFMVSKNLKLIWIYTAIMLCVMYAIMEYLPTQYAQTLF
jgi:rhomboid protease GluP